MLPTELDAQLPLKRKDLALNSNKDQMFARSGYPKKFEFDAQVVQVFDDMINRSVPLYRETIQSIIEWSYLFYQPDTYIYDIGCSTGTVLYALLENLPISIKAVGIDNSSAMIKRARQKIDELKTSSQVTLRCEDALRATIPTSSVVIMNYTLQFIPVSERLSLLRRIHEALAPGGILIISDKLRSSSPRFHEAATRIHEHFKRRAGYSANEIERKKESLDDVLIPFTLAEECELLAQAGFDETEPMFRWNNWCTFMAIKKS